ncbi:hypothetical protein [Silvanigrella sp.]|jgi:hypothetical protein|uniref:hypothetical protein n=1 Tax=Silvanigrella sp. TaxID=2024976 RepID=UPI0037C7BD35
MGSIAGNSNQNDKNIKIQKYVTDKTNGIRKDSKVDVSFDNILNDITSPQDINIGSNGRVYITGRNFEQNDKFLLANCKISNDGDAFEACSVQQLNDVPSNTRDGNSLIKNGYLYIKAHERNDITMCPITKSDGLIKGCKTNSNSIFNNSSVSGAVAYLSEANDNLLLSIKKGDVYSIAQMELPNYLSIENAPMVNLKEVQKINASESPSYESGILHFKKGNLDQFIQRHSNKLILVRPDVSPAQGTKRDIVTTNKGDLSDIFSGLYGHIKYNKLDGNIYMTGGIDENSSMKKFAQCNFDWISKLNNDPVKTDIEQNCKALTKDDNNATENLVDYNNNQRFISVAFYDKK